jgi:hypothetical protein
MTPPSVGRCIRFDDKGDTDDFQFDGQQFRLLTEATGLAAV